MSISTMKWKLIHRIGIGAIVVATAVGCRPEIAEQSVERRAGASGTSAELPDSEQARPEDAAAENPAREPVHSGETSENEGSEHEAPENGSSSAAAEKRAENAEKGTPEVGPITFGNRELTAGIPGEGDLTTEQINAWLEDPHNHEVLDFKLPIGLEAGQAMVFIPEDNPLTRAKIELGRQLYFDRRLSVDSTISCADCHHPEDGYARATTFGIGVLDQEGNRNSPASYNRILSKEQFWDGRAPTLEDQAIGPIANPIEMGSTHEAAVSSIGKVEGYRVQFEKIFDEGVTIENIGKALASFERVLVTGPSPYDFYEPVRRVEERFGTEPEDLEILQEEAPEIYAQYLDQKKASEAHPMSESARRGRAIFFGQKASCTACHTSANFTDEKYHNLGVGRMAENPDLGRFEVTGEEKDKGAFKTPTIRNVTLTAPYMHDGSQATLREVVEWYNKGGHPNPHLSKDIRKLNLTEQEIDDLVAFMEALTGEFPEVEMERLPQ
jgi:cytochrome c peroxidase